MGRPTVEGASNCWRQKQGQTEDIDGEHGQRANKLSIGTGVVAYPAPQYSLGSSTVLSVT